MRDAEGIEIAGVPLRCTHCGGGRFVRRGGDVSALYQDELLPAAAPVVTYACDACGFLHWFGPGAVHEASDESMSCFECGASMPSTSATCTACGWSYAEGPEEERPPDPASEREAEAEPEAVETDVPEPAPLDSPEPIDAAVDTPRADDRCPHCGAERGGRSTICSACGQIFE